MMKPNPVRGGHEAPDALWINNESFRTSMLCHISPPVNGTALVPMWMPGGRVPSTNMLHTAVSQRFLCPTTDGVGLGPAYFRARLPKKKKNIAPVHFGRLGLPKAVTGNHPQGYLPWPSVAQTYRGQEALLR